VLWVVLMKIIPQSEDDRIKASINAVLKDYLSILSSNKSSEDSENIVTVV
jgi:hypothetical protein